MAASKKISAGLLPHRTRDGQLEVLLGHPGGPFWAAKDLGVWSIPKGEVSEGEALLATAVREFQEETGVEPKGPFLELGSIVQKSGKTVHAWSFETAIDAETLKSNLFSMEWPKGSGRMSEFPEIDRFAWFGLDEARRKIIQAQAAFLDRLAART